MTSAADIARRIAALGADQRRELEARAWAMGLDLPSAHIVPCRRDGPTAPLSFEQEYLWFFERLEPGTAIHNLHNSYRLPGGFDLQALRCAVDEIVARHDALRTSFGEAAARPIQRVAPHLAVPLPVVDLRHLPREERPKEAIRRAKRAAETPFDLAAPPLVRFEVLRLGGGDDRLLVTMHHIIADWWSYDVFRRELGELYDARRRDRTPALALLRFGFADYCFWQREWLDADEIDRLLAYWTETLRGAPRLLQLPTDRPAPRVRTFGGARRPIALSPSLARALGDLCRRENVTPFMALLAAMATLFHRYSGQGEVLIGSPNANRRQKGTERLIGFFMNMLVFRVDLAGDPTFRELLGRVRDTAVGAYAHEALPFGKLMEGLRPERDLSRSPIFQAMLILLGEAPSAPDVPYLEALESPHNETEEFDITFALWHGPDSLRGRCDFNTDLWDGTTIDRMIGHFETLLEEVAAEPDRRLSTVSVLTPREEHVLLRAWNDTATAVPLDRCAHEWIEAWSERAPEAVAVSHGSRQVTYGELDRRANRMAHTLRARGVGTGDRVAVCLERSIDLVVALLGVLKSGAAFIPLDPAYPSARLTFMLGDCRAARLVSRRSLVDRHSFSGVPLLPMKPGGFRVSEASEGRPEAKVAPADLAYVIYTSGSTGRPKGVATGHRALVNFASYRVRRYGLGPGDRVLQLASSAYDAAVGDIFPCLFAGGRLVLRGDAMLDSVPRFLEGCRRQGITVIEIPTALWHEIVVQGTGAAGWVPECWRLVVVAGEQVSTLRLAEWYGASGGKPALFNEYGPTETAVSVAMAPLTREEAEKAADSRVAIGLPVHNTQLYALEDGMQPAPVGLAGELHIGGASLTQGYWDRPALTAAGFVPHPFSHRPGRRLYRSGDLVRRRPDGSLEFLRRRDQQVKVSGYRIELGEIEAVLREQPGVGEAVVAVCEHPPGPRRLVAWVVPAAEAPSPERLRAALARRLAGYMVPSAFVPLEELPQTASGKIDGNALPVPVPQGSGTSPAVPEPQGLLAEHLLEIWLQVLGTDRVGPSDDFFELGGHSLLGMQMIARVSDSLGVDLPLRALFDHPTVSGLARFLETSTERGARSGRPPVTALDRRGTAPVTGAQLHLWTAEQMFPGQSFFNMTKALRLRGDLDPARLGLAFARLIRRHEALRTTFSVEGDRVRQTISRTAGAELRIVDLTQLDPAPAESEARRLAGLELTGPFDLGTGPLLRALLLELGPKERILVLTAHHIICDDWSFGVVLRDWAALYEELRRGSDPGPSEAELQFRDFVHWQGDVLPFDLLGEQLEFWREKLALPLPTLDLPTDRPRPARSLRTSSCSLVLSADLTRGIRELGRSESCTLFVTLLAALKALLHTSTGQGDVRVATVVENRNRSELANVVGPLANTLILRSALDGQQSFRELLRCVRETTLAAYTRQDLPFEDLATFLDHDFGIEPRRLAQVMFLRAAAGAPAFALNGVSAVDLEPADDDRRRTISLTSFDLVFAVDDAPPELGVAAMYKQDLFDTATIDRLLADYRDLLVEVVADRERSLSDLGAGSSPRVDRRRPAGEAPGRML